MLSGDCLVNCNWGSRASHCSILPLVIEEVMMPHGHPGTPVGDLFPPGASVLGAGGGLGRQASPHPSSQVMSQGAMTILRPLWPEVGHHLGHTAGQAPPIQLHLLKGSLQTIGHFIQVRRGDEEATAARVAYELNESNAATVREGQLRQEYEDATAQNGCRAICPGPTAVPIRRE